MSPHEEPRFAMNTLRSTIALLVVVSALESRALAREDGKEAAKDSPIKTLFKATDYNKDGKLGPDEWKLKKTIFKEIDGNKDGFLTLAEIEKRPDLVLGELAKGRDYNTSLKDRLERLDVVDYDKNHDGQIDESEHRALFFAAADADEDGAIDLDEADQIAHFGAFNKEFTGEGQHVLDRFDRNKDGLVQWTEFKPDDAEFRSHDKNKDGRLSPDEIDWHEGNGLAAIANQSVDTVMEKLDKNKDGKIEKGEAGGTLGGVLDRYDTDGDGATNRSELDKALKTAQDLQLANMEIDFIARFDLNADKKVSRKEFPGSDAIFERLDKNKDGFVSKADG